jgi:hypothetical protein
VYGELVYVRCDKLKMTQIIWPEEARLSDAWTKGVKRDMMTCDPTSSVAISFISFYPLLFLPIIMAWRIYSINLCTLYIAYYCI